MRIFLSLLILCLAAVAGARGDGVVELETRTGTHAFAIELADTPALRSRGLMVRQSLPDDHGMLFDFGRDQEVSMWMQNTYIPLDMVFIRSDGTVHRIAHDTTPFSTETIPSRGPVRAVLEINAGTAARIGLRPGDRVRHPMFAGPD
jgi:uncharacterized protein